ncbi:hypothetical protein P7K49_010175 [Saguinus oedipus]|uniref:Uncharacterized protein n=1 Tax=Saguinus oedipus TaxID=9490 RepID=A0ABQ9VM41_SAGOE|nr:hypothetical protein P7K49_010175 [Saguinus oedipus]
MSTPSWVCCRSPVLLCRVHAILGLLSVHGPALPCPCHPGCTVGPQSHSAPEAMPAVVQVGGLGGEAAGLSSAVVQVGGLGGEAGGCRGGAGGLGGGWGRQEDLAVVQAGALGSGGRTRLWSRWGGLGSGEARGLGGGPAVAP